MRRRCEDLVEPPVPGVAAPLVRLEEAPRHEVALEAAFRGPARREGVHVARDHRGRIPGAQLPPLLQDHVRNPRVRVPRCGGAVGVRQVRVEEPPGGASGPELGPRHRSLGVVVVGNLHVAARAFNVRHFARIVQDRVLEARTWHHAVASGVGQGKLVLAFLGTHDNCAHFSDLGSVLADPAGIADILRVVAHDLYGHQSARGGWSRCGHRNATTTAVVALPRLVVRLAVIELLRGLVARETLVLHPAAPLWAEREAVACRIVVTGPLALRRGRGVHLLANSVAFLHCQMGQLAEAVLFCGGRGSRRRRGIWRACASAGFLVVGLAAIV
mmetsp:Transcript_102178/g.266664  ORF Transcript_102178/g.266664 Transcript_102178/m.266664 type:complete len:329 (-) Transcript_102178:695-1681(-)